jgi:hypothetical protein
MATVKRKEDLFSFYYTQHINPYHQIVMDVKFTAYPRRCGAWKRLQNMLKHDQVRSIGYTTNNGLR